MSTWNKAATDEGDRRKADAGWDRVSAELAGKTESYRRQHGEGPDRETYEGWRRDAIVRWVGDDGPPSPATRPDGPSAEFQAAYDAAYARLTVQYERDYGESYTRTGEDDYIAQEAYAHAVDTVGA